MSTGNPPAIAAPLGAAQARPRLSVMIPTYEPGPYLLETLRGILAQDPGEDAMQLAVVDDASPTVDVAALLATVAPSGRIEIHRGGTNLGLAGNWNRAIGLARGELVHLLHQDDVILPGFYSRLLKGFAADASVGMAFCRHVFVDAAGATTRRSHRERWWAGPLHGWLKRISRRQRIQCPAAIVQRRVYEQLGGFRDDLVFALDWEMWVRIAAAYPVWYEPATLACYRRHESSETSRLARAGSVGTDTLQAIEIFARHFPAEAREHLASRAYRRLLHVQLRATRKLLAKGNVASALEEIKIARTALARLPDGFATRLRQRQLLRFERECAARDQPG